jgi:hypothetical protein
VLSVVVNRSPDLDCVVSRGHIMLEISVLLFNFVGFCKAQSISPKEIERTKCSAPNPLRCNFTNGYVEYATIDRVSLVSNCF